jgi:hypothetical protein
MMGLIPETLARVSLTKQQIRSNDMAIMDTQTAEHFYAWLDKVSYPRESFFN